MHLPCIIHIHSGLKCGRLETLLAISSTILLEMAQYVNTTSFRPMLLTSLLTPSDPFTGHQWILRPPRPLWSSRSAGKFFSLHVILPSLYMPLTLVPCVGVEWTCVSNAEPFSSHVQGPQGPKGSKGSGVSETNDLGGEKCQCCVLCDCVFSSVLWSLSMLQLAV